jgi:hypothetical protein
MADTQTCQVAATLGPLNMDPEMMYGNIFLKSM